MLRLPPMERSPSQDFEDALVFKWRLTSEQKNEWEKIYKKIAKKKSSISCKFVRFIQKYNRKILVPKVFKHFDNSGLDRERAFFIMYASL